MTPETSHEISSAAQTEDRLPSVQDIQYLVTFLLCRKPSSRAYDELRKRTILQSAGYIVTSEEFSRLMTRLVDGDEGLFAQFTKPVQKAELAWVKEFLVASKEIRAAFAPGKTTKLDAFRRLFLDESTTSSWNIAGLGPRRQERFRQVQSLVRDGRFSKKVVGDLIARKTQEAASAVRRDDELDRSAEEGFPAAAANPTSGHVAHISRTYGDLRLVEHLVEKMRTASADDAYALIKSLFDAGDEIGVSHAYKLLERDEFIDFRKLFAISIFAARACSRQFMFQSAFNIINNVICDERALLGLAPDEMRTAQKILANCYVRIGHTEEAISILDSILLAKPDDFEAHYQLGFLHSVKNRPLARLHLGLAARAQRGVPRPIRLSIAESFREEKDYSEYMNLLHRLLEDGSKYNEALLSIQNYCLDVGATGEREKRLNEFFYAQGLLSPFSNAPDPSTLFGFSRPHTTPNPGGPLVTVITTTYNAEETVRSAVTSILDQTHANLEVFVVDDCSTDRTVGILNEIASADARLNVIRNDRNVGTYVSKNKAIAVAQGEFITFHDSDDWMHPQRIAIHLDLMQQSAAKVSHSSWFRMDRNGYAIAQRHGAFIYRNPASTFFRRDVFGDLGYFDSVRTGADTEMLNRAKTMYGPAAIAETKATLAVGLHHSASLTQSGIAAIDEYRFSATRLAYWEAFGRWHIDSERMNAPLYMPLHLEQRPFDVPEAIAVAVAPH